EPGISGDHTIYGEIRASQVQQPYDMIAIGDSTSDGFWDHWITPELLTVYSWPGTRHTNGAQIVFCDGHVEHIAQKDLLYHNRDDDEDEKVMRRWNNDYQAHLDLRF